MFIKSVCRSHPPHKSVNLSFTITNTKNKLTDLCGNRLLQNDFKNTLCEINLILSIRFLQIVDQMSSLCPTKAKVNISPKVARAGQLGKPRGLVLGRGRDWGYFVPGRSDISQQGAILSVKFFLLQIFDPMSSLWFRVSGFGFGISGFGRRV